MFRSQSKGNKKLSYRAWYDVLMPTPPTSTPTSAYFLQSVTIYNSATVGNVSISTVSYSPLSLRLRHTLQVQTTTVSPTLKRNASAFLEVSGRGSTSRATILLTGVVPPWVHVIPALFASDLTATSKRSCEAIYGGKQSDRRLVGVSCIHRMCTLPIVYLNTPTIYVFWFPELANHHPIDLWTMYPRSNRVSNSRLRLDLQKLTRNTLRLSWCVLGGISKLFFPKYHQFDV